MSLVKPLGTITKYYEFIDEESKSILDSLMDGSRSYYDFVQRLCTHVLENDVPTDLVYLAAVQAWWARIENTMSLIQEKYKENLYVRPWGHHHASGNADQAAYHDDVVRDIEEAMTNSLDDWMKTELFLLHAFYHWPGYGDVPSLLEPLEQAKDLIEANPILNCFEPLVCSFEAMLKRRENDGEGGILDYQRGLKLAEAHDDLLYRYMNLIGMANAIKQLKTRESIALFEELYQLAKDLEVPYFVAEVLNDSSNTFATTGEYDFVIACQEESIEVFDVGDVGSVILSWVYSTLGDGPQALEWANEAFRYAENPGMPGLYLYRSWALAVSGKLEEAEHDLDIAHPLLLMTGSETALADYYRILGVIEFKRGNLLAALDFLEQAHENIEPKTMASHHNTVLLDLARVEIAIDKQSKDSMSYASPGVWLSTLEKRAIERDYPGIRMYAALLKSELYQNHNQLKDAVATLEDALTISDSSGVKTLRKKINDRILELNQLLKEEAVPSKRRRE